MPTRRRRFTEEQKLAILQQADKAGITAVLREHALSYSVFARWKHQFTKDKLSTPVTTTDSKTRSELKQLYEDNLRLRKIIADLAMELDKKDEELKRKNSTLSKR